MKITCIKYLGLCIFIVFFLVSCKTFAQKAKTFKWTSPWIACPATNLHTYGVFNFRKSFRLSARPTSFVIHISADNSYQLFVNGLKVCTGPQLSDVAHWKFDTIDISPYLTAGTNVAAVCVINSGELAAWSQISLQTGLSVQGNSSKEAIINSDTLWKVKQNLAYQPVPVFILSPNEQINADAYPWGWERKEFNDKLWEHAAISETNSLASENRGESRRMDARNLPFPEEQDQSFQKIRKMEGMSFNDDFIKGKGDLTVKAGAKVVIILDQGVLTTAFPDISLSGGAGGKLTVTYAESLINDSDGQKGDRNEVAAKHIKGNQDVIVLDGGDNRVFSTLHYRTFRYVQLDIENSNSPLFIHKYFSHFTAYPFKQNASFSCDDGIVNKIWATGWRTSRLCAYQTYMDCPYYEQLQYIGDTRIQALISLYVSGDKRLMQNAIRQFGNSQSSEGITLSRYPAHELQIIPPFSLFWIVMIHDYWMLRNDGEFVKLFLPAIKKVLDWHKQYLDEKGMLGKMPYWNFVDWPKEWPWKGKDELSGVPEGALEGNSSILTLQYVYALENAAQLYKAFGEVNEAKKDFKLAQSIKKSIFAACWDDERQMLSDSPLKIEFSQHANVMAVLTNTVPVSKQPELLKRVAADTNIVQCTIYYRFYMNQAFKKVGLGNQYIAMLTPWKNMLATGLTTFAERPEPTRSDCHGWSASPTYDLLSTVCGIEPSLPGFKAISIRPNLGYLKWVKGKMPVPGGYIAVMFNKKGRHIYGTISLPPKLTGYCYFNNRKVNLHSGEQEVSL